MTAENNENNQKIKDGPVSSKLDEVGYGSKVWINNMSLNFVFITYWIGMLPILGFLKLIFFLSSPRKIKDKNSW